MSTIILGVIANLGDAEFARVFADLESRARAAMQEEGHSIDLLRLRRAAEMRYAGQAYELTVNVRPEDRLADVLLRFHEEHLKTYGHRSDADPVDVVSVRIRAQVAPRDGAMTYARLAAETRRSGAAQPEKLRRAYFGKSFGFIYTPIIDRATLDSKWREGPLIVEEYDSTCVVPPRARARLDELGNIEIDVRAEAVR